MPTAPSASTPSTSDAFTTYQNGIIEIFSELAELFGNPRSHGMIYGLLFASPSPLSLEEITHRLTISQGSASTGLRQLESFGAVIREKPATSRHALYSAKLELKHLISGFLHHRVLPRLDQTENRARSLRESLPKLEPSIAHTARQRLEKLENWHRNARALFPIAQKFLGLG